MDVLREETIKAIMMEALQPLQTSLWAIQKKLEVPSYVGDAAGLCQDLSAVMEEKAAATTAHNEKSEKTLDRSHSWGLGERSQVPLCVENPPTTTCGI